MEKNFVNGSDLSFIFNTPIHHQVPLKLVLLNSKFSFSVYHYSSALLSEGPSYSCTFGWGSRCPVIRKVSYFNKCKLNEILREEDDDDDDDDDDDIAFGWSYEPIQVLIVKSLAILIVPA